MGTCSSTSRFASASSRSSPITPPSSGKEELISTACASSFRNYHDGIVTSVQCVSENEFISGGDDKKVVRCNWDGSKRVCAIWSGHERAVNKVVYMAKNSSIFSCSRDLTIRQWRYYDSVPENTNIADQNAMQVMRGHRLTISALDINSTNSLLVSGSRDQTVRVWDIETGAEVAHNNTSQNLVTCVKFIGRTESPSLHDTGSAFLQGSEDLRLRVWDIRAGLRAPVSTMLGYQYFPLACDVSADGLYFLTSSKGFNGVGCELRLWDRRMEKQLLQLSGHQQDVPSCAFVPGTPFAASASKDMSVRLWNVLGPCSGETAASTSSRCIAQYSDADVGMFTSLSVAPSGRACVPSANIHAFEPDSSLKSEGGETFLKAPSPCSSNTNILVSSFSGGIFVLQAPPDGHSLHLIAASSSCHSGRQSAAE